MILRVAINCAVTDLDPDCEYGEKYFLYDIVCHQCNIIENTCDIYPDLVLQDILSFIIYEGNYLFAINPHGWEPAQITFNCESIEWIPIKEFNGYDVYFIEETKYINFD